MKPLLRTAAILPVIFLASYAHAQSAQFVDPFLGASGGGNVFPGPVVPFGMIKPGPDMAAAEGHDPNAGWDAKDDIRGFSQTHVSGTGGGAKYGNILVMSTTGALSPLGRRFAASRRACLRRLLLRLSSALRHWRRNHGRAPQRHLSISLPRRRASQSSLRCKPLPPLRHEDR